METEPKFKLGDRVRIIRVNRKGIVIDLRKEGEKHEWVYRVYINHKVYCIDHLEDELELIESYQKENISSEPTPNTTEINWELKRIEIATAAMQGMLSGASYVTITPTFASKKAVQYADALIEELKITK